MAKERPRILPLVDSLSGQSEGNSVPEAGLTVIIRALGALNLANFSCPGIIPSLPIAIDQVFTRIINLSNNIKIKIVIIYCHPNIKKKINIIISIGYTT